MDSVPELLDAGATDIYVNVASFAASPAATGDVLPEIVTAFRKVAA
jgi:hypothetical protein